MANGFPDRLRELRHNKKLSQTQLAELVGVHYNHVGRYERGQSRPSADALKRMADVLGVSADYLIEGTADQAARARFEDRDLLRLFEEIQRLDDHDKNVVKTLLDAFIAKRRIQALVG